MKLLIIAPEQIPVPPPAGGSVENCIYQITKNISRKHQITIVSLFLKHLPCKSIINKRRVFLRVPENRSKLTLRILLKREKGITTFHPTRQHTGLWKKVRKAFPNTKISVLMHSMTFVSSPMDTRRKANAHFKYANLIIGNSKSLKKSLMNRFPKHIKKIRFVHLGVDTQTLSTKQVFFKIIPPSVRRTVNFKKRSSRLVESL